MSVIRKEMLISDLGRVVTGKTPPTSSDHLYGDVYPFITPTDIDGLRYCATSRYLSEQGREAQRNLMLPANTVCVTCIASVGKMCMTKMPSFTNQQINSVIVDEKSHDPFFVYYLLQTKREHLKAIAGGAATPIINKSSFSGIKVLVPDLPTQRRIASILSAYDDLIENNTRRIAILEEMARRIYEEWFVHFRFPGHEQVKMVESELGLIPEGWSIKGVYDISDVTYGFPFKSKEFRSDGVGRGVIRIRDIRDNSPCASTSEEAAQKYLVSRGDILIGMDGQFHMGKWAGPQSWLNQRVLRLKPKADISRNFLFLAVSEPIKVLEKTIVGTTVAHLSAGDMKAMRLIVPSSQLMDMASKVLEPLLELELNLHYKNANLRATRDLLLPKLISGELDVSTLPEPEEEAIQA